MKVITKYSDPQQDYSTKNMPEDLSDEDKKSSVFVTKEAKLKSNLHKIYLKV